EPIFVVAEKKNPWARRRSIELAELVNENWTLPPPHSLIGILAAEAFHARGLEVPRAAVISTSLPMHFAMLATGRYLAIFSKSVVLFNADRLSLKILPVNLLAQSSPVGIVTLKNRTLNPLAKLFIDCARDLSKTFMPAAKKTLARHVTS